MKSKGGWNYRITLERLSKCWYFCLREVHYDKNTGEPTSWTQDKIGPASESWQETYDQFTMMFRAFIEPVLVIDDNKVVCKIPSYAFIGTENISNIINKFRKVEV